MSEKTDYKLGFEEIVTTLATGGLTATDHSLVITNPSEGEWIVTIKTAYHGCNITTTGKTLREALRVMAVKCRYNVE